MKKLLSALLVCTILTLAGCGNNNNTLANEKTIPQLTLTPLYYDRVCRGVNEIYSFIETKEGVCFYPSKGYSFACITMDPTVFSFADNITMNTLKKRGFYISDSEREKEYDFELEISSNSKIYKVSFYDADGTLLGTQKCKENIAYLTPKYLYGHVAYFVLHVKYCGRFYTATFRHVYK